MIPRYYAEAEAARRALGCPRGALEAWDCGAFELAVESDVFVAVLAACVLWRTRGFDRSVDPRAAAIALGRLTAKSLQVIDAWTDRDSFDPHEEPAWLSPVWSAREVSAGVAPLSIGMIGDQFRTRDWLAAFAGWLEMSNEHRRAS